ncbi:UNVERIFIED_CONTAM: hypothetical protein RMT77_008977 [Armadillidium vulgare]
MAYWKNISVLTLLVLQSIVLSTDSLNLPEETKPPLEMTDYLRLPLNLSDRFKPYSVISTITCVFTEVTLPTLEKFKKIGPHAYGSKIAKEILMNLFQFMNLIPESYSPKDNSLDNEEGHIMSQKLGRCLYGSDEGSALQEGRSKGYGDSIVGFALLGLKVVGGLVAFLFWDLNNNM